MRYWVFDLDGTLVDSFTHYFALLERIFEEHGACFTPKLHRAALTESLDHFFAAHLGQAAVEPAFARLHRQSNEDARDIQAFKGLDHLVQKLLKRGDRIAVWTNRDLVSATLILEHSGLAGYVEACVSGTCVVQRKPHPEGLERIIANFGCEPSAVTMVGDHLHDVSAAKKVGARAVRASWHSYWPEEPCATADLEFTRVADFEAWALSL